MWFLNAWLCEHSAIARPVLQPVREVVSYRGLFTAGWFGVREKHGSQLEIYNRLRASEQAARVSWIPANLHQFS